MVATIAIIVAVGIIVATTSINEFALSRDHVSNSLNISCDPLTGDALQSKCGATACHPSSTSNAHSCNELVFSKAGWFAILNHL
ncbi:MAG TPA: hypothetical protein VJ729_04920 [Nitrososphaeraceae archaeon]|nr:hypothetical protein [Nitrososphaeraceae archaeon]